MLNNLRKITSSLQNGSLQGHFGSAAEFCFTHCMVLRVCIPVPSETHEASFALEVKELQQFQSALPWLGGGYFAGRPKMASVEEFENLGFGNMSQDVCAT